MSGDPDVDFACFLGGLARGGDDKITVGAFWQEDGNEREQYWGAHRSCMIEHMAEFTRETGGPLNRD